jgi:hypothetical protein
LSAAEYTLLGFSLLTEAVSPSAFHNAGYHFDSLPYSSVVLDKIKGWISDDTAVPIM